MLKAAYGRGENLEALLRKELGVAENSDEIIELAYDLQTGIYVDAMQDPDWVREKRDYTAAIADLLGELGMPATLLEAGVGEGTTFLPLLERLGADLSAACAFDVSWSRVALARRILAEAGHADVGLCTASLLAIPYPDDAFELVYTSHAIEPNHGREREIVAELARVAARWVIMLEPAYELAPPEARARMDEMRFCRGLVSHAEALGLRVERHEMFRVPGRPTNPTAVTVLRKGGVAPASPPGFVCPRYRTPLWEQDGALSAPASGLVYPVLGGVPCLRTRDAIIASRFGDLAT